MLILGFCLFLCLLKIILLSRPSCPGTCSNSGVLGLKVSTLVSSCPALRYIHSLAPISLSLSPPSLCDPKSLVHAVCSNCPTDKILKRKKDHSLWAVLVEDKEQPPWNAAGFFHQLQRHIYYWIADRVASFMDNLPFQTKPSTQETKISGQLGMTKIYHSSTAGFQIQKLDFS